MIVRERPGLLSLFLIVRGSVLLRILPQMLAMMALSAGVVLAHKLIPDLIPTFSGGPFALLGIALSVFLVFSNNASYDRWWEARKLWGQILANSRNLSRRMLMLEKRGATAQAARQRLADLNIAFVHVLVAHLRPDADAAEKARHAMPADLAAMTSTNRPEFVLREMGAVLADMRADDIVTDIEFRILDDAISHMSEAFTACERIRNTPIPFGYTLLLHRTAYLFCFMLPFGFGDILGWSTPIATAIFGYTFFGLDALSNDLEEPFGTYPNDLPIAALAVGIEIGVRESMGETDLPAMPQPDNYILL